MLELKQTVKLASVNPRAEIHGEDRVPACDLKIEASCDSDVLIYFHSELRGMLYKPADNPDLIEQTEPEKPTSLRFTKLGPLKWDWEGSGYTLTIDYGLGDKSNIVLGDCKIDGIRIDPQNGGTVNLSLRVIAHPEADDMGKLCELIQRDIDIDLAPPAAEKPADLFKDAA